MDQALDMAKIAYEALDEKKGEAIKVIDISQISVIADYFIITNGTSDSQVKALVENVQEKLARVGHHPKQTEGNRSGTQTAAFITIPLFTIMAPNSGIADRMHSTVPVRFNLS